MAVMMRSVNPDAVDEIDPNRDRRRPYVGQSVIFHARPGEARMGKFAAPAIVTAVEDDDHVELLAIYAADDSILRWKIPRKTEQNPFNAWSFNEYDQEHYRPGPALAAPPEPSALRELKEMREHVQELRNRVMQLEDAATSPKKGVR